MKYFGQCLEIRTERGQRRELLRQERRRMPATTTPQVTVFCEIVFHASAVDLASTHSALPDMPPN